MCPGHNEERVCACVCGQGPRIKGSLPSLLVVSPNLHTENVENQTRNMSKECWKIEFNAFVQEHGACSLSKYACVVEVFPLSEGIKRNMKLTDKVLTKYFGEIILNLKFSHSVLQKAPRYPAFCRTLEAMAGVGESPSCRNLVYRV
jgi:hypothetical protein